MSVSIMIRERIKRRITTLLDAISGTGTVHRWDGRGTDQWADLDIVLADLGETVESSAGNYTNKRLTLIALIVLATADGGAGTTDSLATYWAGQIQAALADDPMLIEPAVLLDPAVRLALEMTTEECPAPDWAEGYGTAQVRINVRYTHDINRPCRGPGITCKTE